MHQFHPPYTRRVSSNRALYLKFLSTYTICIIYLHVTEARLEVTIVMFYFCHSTIPSDVMKNIFNSISPYIWEKISLLTNIRNKRDFFFFFLKNKKSIRFFFFFFCDVVKKYHIFPLKVCNFQYGHRFFFSKETRNIRAYKKVRLKMRNHLGRVFPCFFLQIYFPLLSLIITNRAETCTLKAIYRHIYHMKTVLPYEVFFLRYVFLKTS